ncbi:TonB-dependent receptor [Duganella sp. BJB1802]|uniref:TonB-dependent siderophore receptor n=1 Tax=Duganella sp. BJB1802 TaxID=2744575 RepID=UPI00159411BB|nr:TonB-dependent receptor [Duganella sp. BJB1802]NVD70991.1 TonB-dependent receptor [Duganella sp. BJB1802]
MRRATIRPLPRKLRLCVMLSSLALSLPVAALAQPASGTPSAPTQSYALPAGPLGAALQQIAAIGGRAVLFSDADAARLISAPVSGQLTELEAVNAALAGSGLTVAGSADGALIVAAGAPPQTVLVIAQRDQAETSFQADYSKTTTRSGATLREVPQSVTIITAKVLETQQVTSLQDALRNVSGVAFSQSPQGLPTFSVRGFTETSTTTNGVADRGSTQTNVYGVERLEVLKGPQAILAGAGSLGGGVNVVMKKPQATTVRDLTVQYGSHDDVTLAADLSGALTADKRLTFRLIGSDARASGTTVGYDGRRDQFLMPELRWKDAATDVTAGLSYGKQDLPVPAYTFATRRGAIIARPDMLLSNPNDGFDSTNKKLFYQFQHRFAPWLTFESRVQRSLGKTLLHLYTPYGLMYAGTGVNAAELGTSPFGPGASDTVSRTTAGDHFFNANFDTGEVEHRLAVGYAHTDTDSVQTQRSGTPVVVRLYPPSGYAFADAVAAATVVQGIYSTDQTQKAFYLQDLMKWGDWNLQLNARHTKVVNGGRTAIPSSHYDVAYAPNAQSKTTPGVGLVYDVSRNASVYASMAQGFALQNSNLCGGGVAPPTSTRNKEAGAKFGFLEDKLSLTTSVFELNQTNLLQYQSVSRCYALRDAQQTRGAELDMQGQLAAGWNAVMNYTYNTYRDTGMTGRLFPGLPKHKMSAWSTYDFQNAALKGFGFGLGISATAHTIGSSSASSQFMLPGQAQIDASLFYRRGKWDVTLGVKNLADRVLYGVSTANSYIPLFEGRAYMLTVRRSFE